MTGMARCCVVFLHCWHLVSLRHGPSYVLDSCQHTVFRMLASSYMVTHSYVAVVLAVQEGNIHRSSHVLLMYRLGSTVGMLLCNSV